MTIQLKNSIFIAGVHQSAGTSLTLGADMEAELVNRGVAVFTNRTQTPGEGVSPAMFYTDANGNITLLDPQGNGISLGGSVAGAKVLLLGDSMTQNNNQSLVAASATFSRINGVTNVAYTGHALISGQLISVGGFSASFGFNANRVEITRIDANNFTYANAGADIGATAGTNSSSTNPITVLDWGDSRSPFVHANTLLNGGLQLVNNAGIGGDTFGSMLSRLSTDVDAYEFDQLWLHGGYNALNSGVSAATEWANCKAIIDKYLALGKLVVLQTVLPVGPGHSKQADAAFITSINELRKYQLEYQRNNLIVVDSFLDAIDPLSAPAGLTKANMTGDTVHPAAKLMRAVGTRIKNAIVDKIIVPDLRAASNADNYAYNSASQQLLNAGWAATGGPAPGTGITGTSPPGMKADTGGTITATVTGTARADGFGYDMVMTVATTSAGATPRCVMDIAAGFVAGDKIVCVCEVTISGVGNVVRGVYGQLRQIYSGITGFAYSANASSTSALWGTGDGTYLLVTPPMKVQPGVTSLQFSALVSVDAISGGTGTISFGRPAVYKNLFNERD